MCVLWGDTCGVRGGYVVNATGLLVWDADVLLALEARGVTGSSVHPHLPARAWDSSGGASSDYGSIIETQLQRGAQQWCSN